MVVEAVGDQKIGRLTESVDIIEPNFSTNNIYLFLPLLCSTFINTVSDATLL